jgi:hypothetical protein
MGRTKTVRVFEDDASYAKLLAFLLDMSGAELFHAALEDYAEARKPHLDARLGEIQEAVLSGDRDKFREIFLTGVPAQVERDSAAISALIGAKEDLTVEEDEADPPFVYGDPDELEPSVGPCVS